MEKEIDAYEALTEAAIRLGDEMKELQVLNRTIAYALEEYKTARENYNATQAF